MANKLDIEVIADIKQILGALNTLNQRVDDFSQNATKSSDRVNKSLGGITGTIAKVGLAYQGFRTIWADFRGFFGDMIQAANEAEGSQIKLRQALKSTGQYTEEMFNDLVNYATELQRSTGISDDMTVSTMGMLTAMGLTGENLKRATVLAQDLSITMDTDMRSSARVMADAFNGQTGMLGRYIKGLDEADIKQRGAISIIEQLERAVGGQARAFGQEAPGAMKRYSENLGDLKEVVGATLRNNMMPFLMIFEKIVLLLQRTPAVVQTVVFAISALAIAFRVLHIAMSKTNIIIAGILAVGSGIYSLFIREKKVVADLALNMTSLNREREKFLNLSKGIAEMSDIDQLKRMREEAQEQLRLAQGNLEGWKKKNKQIMSALTPAYEAFFDQWKKENADYIKSNPQWQLQALKAWQDYLKQQVVGYENYIKAIDAQSKRLKPQEKLKNDIKEFQNSIDYFQYVEGLSLQESREKYLNYLKEKIDAIKGNTDEEIAEKLRLQVELGRIQNNIASEQKEKIKQTNEDIADIITGGGYGAAYETVMQRIKQRMVVWAVQEIKLAAWLEKTKFALKEAWAGRTLAMEQLFSGKEILLNLKTSASNFIAGMTNLFKSVMKIPFPGNVLAFAAGGATVIGLLNSFKTKGQSVIKAAEGALINKPTLALVGEAVARSGPELITPMKTFKQVVNDQIMPELRAKLDSNINFNTKALEDRLERVESAIYATRNTLTERGIAKAVTRTGRRKLS
jgi:regulator of replication initiation timing